MTKNIQKYKTPDLNKEFTSVMLGRVIKAKRSQANLKIEDAAALCGIAKQTFMNIEHGKPTVKFDSVLKVCKNLGIKLLIEPWQDNLEQDDEWQ